MRMPQLLTALLLLGMLASAPAAAQEVPIGWEMGLTPAPGSEEVNFTLGDDGEVGLSFWVRNDYETNSITVTIDGLRSSRLNRALREVSLVYERSIYRVVPGHAWRPDNSAKKIRIEQRAGWAG